ncbi:hypothetical protein R1sor_016215 [Riccia sorocarpa]|uniref:Phospholipid scramblase n=1 Tax=Riccia sorocarpa TaxID=122646 RepID=A0ABD3HII4_9MARC
MGSTSFSLLRGRSATVAHPLFLAGQWEVYWGARAVSTSCVWEESTTAACPSAEGHESASRSSSPGEFMGFLQSRLCSRGGNIQPGSRSLSASAFSPSTVGTLRDIRETARGMPTVRWAHSSSDEWLVQRARADRKRREARDARSHTRIIPVEDGDTPYADSGGNYVNPGNTEEKLAGILGRPDLIITRNVEWANLAFGFEQQNKYVIMDPREPHAPVGYILEDSNIFIRQFLRRRRPFIALVLDAYGNEVFRVRRPAWLINSTIYVEVDGQIVGEAHRRWHIWKRVYDVYLGKQQFAAVENPGFWYWTFTLQDENKGVLAVIDRNWRGFGYEFLTDAGQYVVRFGDIVPEYVPAVYRPATVMGSVKPVEKPVLAGSPSAAVEVQNLQAAAQEAEPLVVERPLTLFERAVTLALAVSLDNDYFSTHSRGVGFVPLPFFGGGQEVADSDRNLPMEDESPFPFSASHDTATSDASEQAEPLERVIGSDDTAGDAFQDPWKAEDVEADIFGSSPADSWIQNDEPQDDGDFFGGSGFFGQSDDD